MLRAFVEMKQRDVEITMEGLIAEVEKMSEIGTNPALSDGASDGGGLAEEDVLRILRAGDAVSFTLSQPSIRAADGRDVDAELGCAHFGVRRIRLWHSGRNEGGGHDRSPKLQCRRTTVARSVGVHKSIVEFCSSRLKLAAEARRYAHAKQTVKNQMV